MASQIKTRSCIVFDYGDSWYVMNIQASDKTNKFYILLYSGRSNVSFNTIGMIPENDLVNHSKPVKSRLQNAWIYITG